MGLTIPSFLSTRLVVYGFGALVTLPAGACGTSRLRPHETGSSSSWLVPARVAES
jgi:hypothetical protein